MYNELDDFGGMDVSDLSQPPPPQQYQQQQQPQQQQYQQNQQQPPQQQQQQQQYQQPQQQQYQPQYNNSYGGNKPNYGGGKKQWSGGGGGGFQKKEDVVEDPYLPVAVYVDRDFPPQVKDQLFKVITTLTNAGITVRVNGDDREFYDRISTLPGKNIEVYTPWKGFNDIDTKHYFNMETSKHMASINFAAWDKIPDVVKSMLARNVRMIFGGKNNSIVKCLVTWSPDGVSKSAEITKDTGKGSFMIGLASKYYFPVINLGKAGAEDMLARVFNL